jgi:hypothetical protein
MRGQVTEEYTILVGQSEDHFRGLGVDGRIILRGILKKRIMRIWTGFNLLRIRISSWQ